MAPLGEGDLESIYEVNWPRDDKAQGLLLDGDVVGILFQSQDFQPWGTPPTTRDGYEEIAAKTVKI
ncbi:hypothetical protein CIW49_13545 [Mycolicibacterium sp. P1-18]|uniref:hypothetical protein n=1 Tax=Mycolicibacterium sp. P1-18 TaxID=2024615 RepID=UPI0011F108EE|nr:hypothetical protein [Mycolicibacterium sp. P1-18]KAA0098896.1 hypothetical protein CIW49_13545 [Mycolicibacterium sp. P1-18]